MAVGPPIIVRSPLISFEYGETPAVEDISAAVRTVTFDVTEDVNDIPTFEEPDATTPGKTTWQATIAIYWTDDIYDSLLAAVGETVTFRMQHQADDTKETVFVGTYGHVPFGAVVPSEPIEADLVVSLTGAPTRGTATP